MLPCCPVVVLAAAGVAGVEASEGLNCVCCLSHLFDVGGWDIAVLKNVGESAQYRAAVLGVQRGRFVDDLERVRYGVGVTWLQGVPAHEFLPVVAVA